MHALMPAVRTSHEAHGFRSLSGASHRVDLTYGIYAAGDAVAGMLRALRLRRMFCLGVASAYLVGLIACRTSSAVPIA